MADKLMLRRFVFKLNLICPDGDGKQAPPAIYPINNDSVTGIIIDQYLPLVWDAFAENAVIFILMRPFLFLLIPLLAALPCLQAEEHNFQLLKKPLFFKVHASGYSHTQPEYLKGKRIGAFGSYLKASQSYNSVAADWSFLPMGSVFRIKSYGQTQFVVDDHLPSVAGKAAIKIYFNFPREARQWKAQHLNIEVLRVGDFRASYKSLRSRASESYCRTMAQRIYRRLQGDDYRDFSGGNWNRGTTKYIKPEDLPKKSATTDEEEVSEGQIGALFPGL